MTAKPSRFLRVLVMILLGLTAAVTLLGGAGTTCVAFNAEKFGASMAPLIPVKPIFQVLVFVSLAAAVYGVYAVVQLGRGSAKGYTQTMIFLVVAGLASAVQFYYSLTLRGKTAPNNMRLYITLFTLAVMLLLRLPGLWAKTGFGRGSTGGSGRLAGGAAMIVAGLVTLTTPLWAAPTHVIDGWNTVTVLLWPLIVLGAGLTLAGGLLLRPRGTPERAAEARLKIEA